METPISVFLITLNEGKHIRRVLNSVSWADEVIVMDSGSTDATVEICKQMAVQVLHQDWLGYSAQKAAALARCRNEWCLNIDGDEIVSESLKLELQKRVALEDVAGIEIPIND
ncbi:MAG: glycosyltransferase family 2 protein, partial [Pseudomonadota bacterium]|nr:glycosyltransferase family 2 protein [Pseudomonadota bacterium]